MTICPECGSHTHYAQADCKSCGKPIHVEGCPRKAPECKCHQKNDEVWTSKLKAKQKASDESEKKGGD